MNKKVKIALIITLGVLVVGGIIGSQLRNHVREQREMRAEEEMRMAEMAEEEKIRNAYRRVNDGFYIIGGMREGYLSLHEPNKGGVRAGTYLRLLMYEFQTGIHLPYETVIDYFSEEFEPDGSLRLYNNGKHPEIEAFVVWASGLGIRECEDFRVNIARTYREYTIVNSVLQGGDFVWRFFDELSREMYDALFRKLVDPDYELDLTSLQERGSPEEIEVENAYVRVNYAFGLPRFGDDTCRLVYISISEIEDDGLPWFILIYLQMYESRTGISLSYEKVLNYLSEEFEPDGNLRLYNNGRHPEIEAYVNWVIGLGSGEGFQYEVAIRRIFDEYKTANSTEVGGRFIPVEFSDLSPEMFAALARKEANPDYELDLTRLQ